MNFYKRTFRNNTTINTQKTEKQKQMNFVIPHISTGNIIKKIIIKKQNIKLQKIQ